MFKLPIVKITNLRTGAVLGERIRFADNAVARLIGLLGARELQPGEGLLLAPSSGVHTCGMSFPIDVIALDRCWRVQRIWEQVLPWRILCPSLKTRSVLELPAGIAGKLQVRIGDQLAVR